MYRSIAVGAACLCLVGQAARAQTVLTLDDVMARARDQAAGVMIARARAGEAEAALRDAARRRDNPVVSAALGPRRGDERDFTDVSIGVSQQFEGAGQRRARVDLARAAADRQRAETPQAARDAVVDAVSTFIRAVAAQDRLQIAGDAETISRGLLTATERRYAAGDIAAIDLNLARIDTARSAAATGTARAELDDALGTLKALLRLPAAEPVDVRGSLDTAAVPAIGELEALVSRRPELATLEAELAEADAQARLGRALARPDLGAMLNYEREASDTILLGGLTVTLPAFQSGQGTLAAGLARANRVRLELSLAREQALADLRTAHAVYVEQRQVADAFVRDAMASVADNESLAQRSFDAGEIDLMDLLLIRRDAIDTRRSAVDRRLDAALSRMRVDAAAGVLR